MAMQAIKTSYASSAGTSYIVMEDVHVSEPMLSRDCHLNADLQHFQ